MTARALTAPNGHRYDGDTETFVTHAVAPPLDLGAADGPRRNQDAPFLTNSQGVRRLTPRECERLQGFPDDWTLIPGATDSKRYAALGDAVTVPVARWIGERLQRYAA